MLSKKLSTADISAFLQLIGKLSLSDWPRLARGSDWHRLALIGTDWHGMTNWWNERESCLPRVGSELVEDWHPISLWLARDGL